jgi:5-aminopentanamidase
VRVGIYQCESRPGEVAANLDRLARAAGDARVDVLLCPEMFLTGYNIGADAVRRLAEPADGASAQAVAAIARSSGVAILYGYPELDGAVFNAVQLVGADGARLANYRKTHLYGELDRSQFSASDAAPPLVELGDWRLGLLICYDVEFPENTRALALAGADLILAPTANMVPYDVVATTIVPARAYESQVYVAYANYCGREGELEYCGLSCIAAPDGTDAARAGRGEELVVGELDRARLASTTYLADRRPELYQELASPLRATARAL